MKRIFSCVLLFLLVNLATSAQSVLGSWFESKNDLKTEFGDLPVTQVMTFNEDNTFSQVFTTPVTMDAAGITMVLKLEITTKGTYKINNKGNVKFKSNSCKITNHDVEFPGLSGEQEAACKQVVMAQLNDEYFQSVLDGFGPKLNKHLTGESICRIDGDNLWLGSTHYERIKK